MQSAYEWRSWLWSGRGLERGSKREKYEFLKAKEEEKKVDEVEEEEDQTGTCGAIKM